MERKKYRNKALDERLQEDYPTVYLLCIIANVHRILLSSHTLFVYFFQVHPYLKWHEVSDSERDKKGVWSLIIPYNCMGGCVLGRASYYIIELTLQLDL